MNYANYLIGFLKNEWRWSLCILLAEKASDNNHHWDDGDGKDADDCELTVVDGDDGGEDAVARSNVGNSW